MNPISRVAIALLVMACLLAKRLKVGPVLLAAAAVLLALTDNGPSMIPELLVKLFTDKLYYWVLAIVVGVSLLGTILKELNKIPLLVKSLESLLNSRKLILPLLPLLIGALPMPGGAYLSAPMVDQAAKGTKLSKEKRTVLNHWFRHQLEFIFPLYPGFILAASLCNIELRVFALYTFPLTIFGFIFGYIFLLHNEDLGVVEVSCEQPWTVLASAIWPVITVVSLTFLGLPFVVSLAISIISLALSHGHSSWKSWKPWLLKAASFPTFVMVTGIFAFKHTVEVTGLTNELAPALTEIGLPIVMVLAAVPFILGLLAGYAPGYVAISYPVLLPLITSAGGIVNPWAAMWIYAAGWAGMMLSPVHLCLVLTREYFDSSWPKVYMYLGFLCSLTTMTAWLLNSYGPNFF